MIMQTCLTWRKGLFSNLYEIYSSGNKIGNLRDKTFSRYSSGEINNQRYLFKTSGVFKQHTQIFDQVDNKFIGEIDYNNWMTKATLTINGKLINWRYDNLWNTKWRLINSEGIDIKYSGSSNSGRIDSNVDDALLLLSGLFVTNYYWESTITIMIAIFLPLWMIFLS